MGKQAFIGRPALERPIKVRRGPALLAPLSRILGRSPLRTMARIGSRPLVGPRYRPPLRAGAARRSSKRAPGQRIRDVVVTDAGRCVRSVPGRSGRAVSSANGVRRVRFLDEPVAAAIGYGLGLKQNRLALVVDFGGGTLRSGLGVPHRERDAGRQLRGAGQRRPAAWRQPRRQVAPDGVLSASLAIRCRSDLEDDSRFVLDAPDDGRGLPGQRSGLLQGERGVRPHARPMSSTGSMSGSGGSRPV